MCTLAWGKRGNGVWICFNRDEQRSRPSAEPPQVHGEGENACLYARDPEGGGTWLAASTAGYLVGLLNHYPGGERGDPAGTRSRGLLVKELAGLGDPVEACRRIGDKDLRPYRPFRIFFLSIDRMVGFVWDGQRLAFAGEEGRFWTSSSHQPGEVADWRRRYWRKRTGGRDLGPARSALFLRDRHPRKPAFGLTMDREDARTVSQAVVLLEPHSISYTYRSREGNGPGYGPPVTIRHPD
ncbi:MAG: NRDE family protein [Oceanipulchritudo sp.]